MRRIKELGRAPIATIDDAWAAYQAMCHAQVANPALLANHFWIKHRDRLWADWARLFEEAA